MKKIVVLCAGDFGREVVWLIEDINKVNPTYDLLGFIDDNPDKFGCYYQLPWRFTPGRETHCISIDPTTVSPAFARVSSISFPIRP